MSERNIHSHIRPTERHEGGKSNTFWGKLIIIHNNIVDFEGLLLPVPTPECIISHYRSNRSCTWMKKRNVALLIRHLARLHSYSSYVNDSVLILQVCCTFLSGGSRGLQLLALSWWSSSNFRLIFSMESWSMSQNPARSWATGRGWAFGFCWVKRCYRSGRGKIIYYY